LEEENRKLQTQAKIALNKIKKAEQDTNKGRLGATKRLDKNKGGKQVYNDGADDFFNEDPKEEKRK
jgi:hypothetical protein